KRKRQSVGKPTHNFQGNRHPKYEQIFGRKDKSIIKFIRSMIQNQIESIKVAPGPQRISNDSPGKIEKIAIIEF
ncbi:MAG: hypothetical protein ABF391_17525, partial [Akkermansiaceae bacterium]